METQYLPVSFKSKKVTQIYNYSKLFSSKRNVLSFLSRYTKHAHDILSKKFIEDSVPIATTPETEFLREGILAGNIREIISLHEVLAY